MDTHLIKIEGQKSDLEMIAQEMKEMFPEQFQTDTIRVDLPTPIPKSLFDKNIYHQNEVFVMIISLGVNVASTLLSDTIKAAVNKIIEKRRLGGKTKIKITDKNGGQER